jgi:simple sugar transport system permease protein
MPSRAASDALRANLVPILFAAVCAAGIAASSHSTGFFAREVLERSLRNAFIVLSLVIPIVAGLGLNFGIVLGAMAGEVGIIVAENCEVAGLPGLGAAAAISIPISVAVGWAVGRCMNAARGREMVAGLILGFFANGIYQLVFLLLAGPVIPLRNPRLVLDGGVGLRNSIDLESVAEAFGRHPREAAGAIIAALALALVWFQRTKLGSDLRAVGQDQHVSAVLGIDVDRKRIVAMILSTVLGGLGMVLYVHDIGSLNTFQSHEQVGFYAIAALLVGGATVQRATVWQALVGTVLFNTLILVLTQVGQERLGSPQVGEYLREFTAYTIIGVTLAIHAWSTRGRRSE